MHALLIIDNCEHVIGEVARVAEALIRKCPRLSILATSRERLAIPGESVIRVPSLAVPQPGAEAGGAPPRGYAAGRPVGRRRAAPRGRISPARAPSATRPTHCPPPH